MLKTTVTRLFLGGALAVISGGILAIAAVWIAIENNIFVMNGPDIVGLSGSALTWTLLVIGTAGAVTVIGGLIAALVSWIGALLNTAQLERKTWFVAMLVLGIFNLGLFAMIAYVLAGPDVARGSKVGNTGAALATPA